MQMMGYERGLHLRGTPLWFDAERRRELCVLTGVERQLPPVHRRVVASAPMAEALDGSGYGGSILPTPWKRWVGLGGQMVQLIDAGAPPGCAAALVHAGDEAVLVAGQLRVPAADWPRANHVVARLPALRHRGAPLAQVALAVAKTLEEVQAAGHRPTVWVDSCDLGLALWAQWHGLGIEVRPLGVLGKLTGSASQRGGRGVTLAVARPRQVLDAAAVRIDSGLGIWGAEDDTLPPPVKVRWYADLAALQAVIAACRAHRVTLVDVPLQAEAVVAAALGRGVTVRFLSDAQQLSLGQDRLEQIC
jgi:hypothetical protein